MEFQVFFPFFISFFFSLCRGFQLPNHSVFHFFTVLVRFCCCFVWMACDGLHYARAARKSIHFAVESQFIVFSSAVCRSSIWSIYLFFPASLRRRRTAGLRRDYWARYRGFHSHPNSTARLSLCSVSFSLKSIFMRFFNWKWESRAIRTTENSYYCGGRDSLATRNICALFHLIS